VPQTPAPFRCAVLGAAKHEYVVHGLAAHPRFEVAVVADDPGVPAATDERNARLAAAYGVPYLRDVERALSAAGVRVAIVCPEVARHVDLSVRAARAGKHIVQDKPLTTRREEADRLVAAVEAAGVRFLMWNRNEFPAVRHAREQIAAGAVGRPRAIHVDFYFAKDAGPPRGSPPGAAAAAAAAGWEGMGELTIEGIYPLAYVRALAGAEVRRVFARTATHFHQRNVERGVEDLATVTLDLEGGAVATLAIGRIGAASHHSDGEISLRVLGTAGALVAAEARPEAGVYYRGQPPDEARQRRLAVTYEYLLADGFARAIDEGGETALDARASRRIFATVEAALESARSGRPVDVRP
jgi:predicted dehydrogenase